MSNWNQDNSNCGMQNSSIPTAPAAINGSPSKKIGRPVKFKEGTGAEEEKKMRIIRERNRRSAQKYRQKIEKRVEELTEIVAQEKRRNDERMRELSEAKERLDILMLELKRSGVILSQEFENLLNQMEIDGQIPNQITGSNISEDDTDACLQRDCPSVDTDSTELIRQVLSTHIDFDHETIPSAFENNEVNSIFGFWNMSALSSFQQMPVFLPMTEPIETSGPLSENQNVGETIVKSPSNEPQQSQKDLNNSGMNNDGSQECLDAYGFPVVPYSMFR